jgi:hypothetical protein
VQNVLRWEKEEGAAFVPSEVDLGSASNVLDRWIAAASRSLTAFVKEEMEAYRCCMAASPPSLPVVFVARSAQLCLWQGRLVLWSPGALGWYLVPGHVGEAGQVLGDPSLLLPKAACLELPAWSRSPGGGRADAAL